MVGELPDLILLDVVMPGLDGYELTKMLKHDPKTLRLLYGRRATMDTEALIAKLQKEEEIGEDTFSKALNKFWNDAAKNIDELGLRAKWSSFMKDVLGIVFELHCHISSV